MNLAREIEPNLLPCVDELPHLLSPVSLRFRCPAELFSLDLQPTTTVGLLKILIESRSGILMSEARLYYGNPRRELFGRDDDLVYSVLSIEPDQPPQTLTIELKPSSSAKSAVTPMKLHQDLSSSSSADFDVSSDFAVWSMKHQLDDSDEPGAGDDLDNFVAWLEHDPSMGPNVFTVNTPVQPLSSPTAVDSEIDGDEGFGTLEEDDPFANGGDDDDGGWGDDGDEFIDENEADDMTAKEPTPKQASVATSALMQSSAECEKLGTYEILSLPTLLSIQKRTLSELDELIGCSMNESIILMRHYRWNKDRLFQAWLKDPTGVQAGCGLVRMQHRQAKKAEESIKASPCHASSSSSSSSVSFGDCPLCGDQMQTNNSFDLGCSLDGSHRFCLSCWQQWATAEMDKGPQALRTSCCAFKCKEIIPDDIILSLLDTKKRKLYSKWSLRNYVDSSPTLSWCVNSRCSKVVRFNSGGARDVECECGARFCFACKYAESHSPAQCEVVHQWTKKNSSDRDNQDWIVANTSQTTREQRYMKERRCDRFVNYRLTPFHLLRYLCLF